MRSAFHKFNQALLRCGIEHVEILDLRFESKLLEFRGNPLGVLFVVVRPYVVRMRGKTLHISAMIRWIGNGAHLFFPLALNAGRIRAEAEKRGFVSRGGIQKWQEGGSGKQTRSNQKNTFHESPAAI